MSDARNEAKLHGFTLKGKGLDMSGAVSIEHYMSKGQVTW